MLKIPRLVGVNHGGILPGMFYSTEFRTIPSVDLQADFARYPRCTVVGIEYFPEVPHGIRVRGVELPFKSPTSHYWTCIENCLQKYGLKVLFLDSLEPYVKAAELQIEIEEKREQLHDTEDPNLISKLEEEIKILKHRSEYLLVVEREYIFAEQIRNSRPEVVLVGDDHASYFFAEAEEVGKLHGIRFKSYDRDELPEDLEDIMWDILGDEPKDMEMQMRLIRNAQPDPKFLSWRKQNFKPKL